MLELGQILTELSDGVAVCDREFRFVFVNPTAASMAQKSPEELVGKVIWDVIPDTSGTAFERRFRRVAETHERGTWESYSPRMARWFDYTAYAIGEHLVLLIRDITLQKQRDLTERAREQRFRFLVESNLVAVLFGNLRGEVKDANDAFLNVVGYSREELRQGKLDLQRLTPPEFQDHNWQRIEEAQRAGVSIPFEKEYIRKDGTRVPVLVSLALLGERRDEIAAIVIDLTESKQKELQLRSSEQQFRLLAEAIPQMVWTTDESGHHLYFNTRWYQYTGTSPESALGWKWMDVLHPDDVARTCTRWQHSLKTGEVYRIEYRVRSAEGRYRWFLGQALPVHGEGGKIIQWFGTLTDVHDQRMASDALKRQAILLEQVYEPIIVRDQHDRISFWNRGAEHVYGWTPREAVGRVCHDLLKSEFPVPLETIREQMQRRGHWEGEVRHFTRSGEPRIVLSRWRADPVTKPALYTIETNYDLTEHKKAQQALIQTEKLAVAGRLAASIAHEINNPLEAVMNLVYLIGRAESLGDVAQYVRLAEHELVRVSEIVTHTLRFYRQSSAATECQLNELADSVLVLNERRLRQAGISVEREFKNVPDVMCFAGEMRQVIANLVGNAIDAMPGGGRLRLRIRGVVNGNHQASAVRLTVADTGTGMTPEVRRRVFEPFFSTKTSTGTGLGLWVAAEILQKHRARLKVRSRPKHGTVFTVELPLKRQTEGTIPASAA